MQGGERAVLVGEVSDKGYIIYKQHSCDDNCVMSDFMAGYLAAYESFHFVNVVFPSLHDVLVNDAERQVMLGDAWKITMKAFVRFYMKQSFNKPGGRRSVSISRHQYAEDCCLPFDMPIRGEHESCRVLFSPESLQYEHSFGGKHFFKVTYKRSVSYGWVEQVNVSFFHENQTKKTGESKEEKN